MEESQAITTVFNSGPERLISIAVFIVGFGLSVLIWLLMTTGNRDISSLLAFAHHNRSMLMKSLFTDGPGYLILPLWLVLAEYLGPVLMTLVWG
ncbi:MAG: hypothetical protein ACN4GW_07895 [Desulforhopalus sp.]